MTRLKEHLILPIIVLTQLACGSLWFASNGVMSNLQQAYGLHASALSHLTSFVQFGFISGTLIFALLTLSDRFSPSKVFFSCATLGAVFNVAIIFGNQTLTSLLVLRFLTGFCLAGIYPVGMKIAADYHESGLGRALGYLVGALVIGTAFPHLLKDLTQDLPWKYVLIFISLLSLSGAVVMLLFVPDGPFRRPSPHIDPKAFFNVFRDNNFRAAAFGYFGHMWELYTFWTFIPLIFLKYNQLYPGQINIPLFSFLTIAAGGVSCFIGGVISQKTGSRNVAIFSLTLSGICCLLSPFLFTLNKLFLILFMLVWGMFVVSDSPQFSTLVAQYAVSKTKGTALTIVNCIGFAITIVSIQLFNYLIRFMEIEYIFLVLIIGPVFGIFSMSKLDKHYETIPIAK
jgi:predicted MFS family arabinose efflux permease